jgi:hypothetical protein
MDLNNNKMLIQKAVPKLRLMQQYYIWSLALEVVPTQNGHHAVNRFQSQSES